MNEEELLKLIEKGENQAIEWICKRRAERYESRCMPELCQNYNATGIDILHLENKTQSSDCTGCIYFNGTHKVIQ